MLEDKLILLKLKRPRDGITYGERNLGAMRWNNIWRKEVFMDWHRPISAGCPDKMLD